jgi:hypothetical protein
LLWFVIYEQLCNVHVSFILSCHWDLYLWDYKNLNLIVCIMHVLGFKVHIVMYLQFTNPFQLHCGMLWRWFASVSLWMMLQQQYMMCIMHHLDSSKFLKFYLNFFLKSIVLVYFLMIMVLDHLDMRLLYCVAIMVIIAKHHCLQIIFFHCNSSIIYMVWSLDFKV